MPFTSLVAERIVSRYLCARCYHTLYRKHAPMGLETVECPDCGNVEDEGVGRVTKWWAERQGQQNLKELHEAQANLTDLFPQEKLDKPVKDALAELGF